MPHFWLSFMPTLLLFPPDLAPASPRAPHIACFKHPRFLPSWPPLSYKTHPAPVFAGMAYCLPSASSLPSHLPNVPTALSLPGGNTEGGFGVQGAAPHCP